ncbi:uncharacterized protein LOC142817508 [Rhipicephalus microplus]|uniref:uncharacterized protein LOC142817508 n=1 Tax=Rhipicephalus microplus TaxID=6941 RepID=UPI003F6CA07B
MPHPSEDHHCQSRCQLCGKDHLTADKLCKDKFKTPYIVKQRQRFRQLQETLEENYPLPPSQPNAGGPNSGRGQRLGQIKVLVLRNAPWLHLQVFWSEKAHYIPFQIPVMFNEKQGKGPAGKPHTMENAEMVDKWHMKIKPGGHYILSTHVSDELNKFPANGLGKEFFLDAFALDIGSFCIFELKYTGTDGMLMVSFSVPSGTDKFTAFRKTPLKDGDDFLVYIRSAPTGWLVQTSFQDAAALVIRPGVLPSISPKFSAAYIKRMYVVSGAEATHDSHF